MLSQARSPWDAPWRTNTSSWIEKCPYESVSLYYSSNIQIFSSVDPLNAWSHPKQRLSLSPSLWSERHCYPHHNGPRSSWYRGAQRESCRNLSLGRACSTLRLGWCDFMSRAGERLNCMFLCVCERKQVVGSSRGRKAEGGDRDHIWPGWRASICAFPSRLFIHL